MAPAASPDEEYMRRALKLARQAGAAGETPVGALVVLDGIVIAAAGEAVRARHDLGGHAELLALRAACRAVGSFDLSAATLVTTAEPCWMCSFAARQARIGRVVIGRATPDIGGASPPFPILAATSVPRWGPPPVVVSGVLAAECAALRRASPPVRS
ncbi:MAG: nucleoside deaminase [Terriglobales bacterium]